MSLFAAPPWDRGLAGLAFGIVLVITAAVLIRAFIGWTRSSDSDATASKPAASKPVAGKFWVWVLFAGGAVTIVLFAIAMLKANQTLTALAIGPHPLRVVPTQVTLGFILVAVATRELGWPRKPRQALTHAAPEPS